jgi:hypothetical protein
MISPGSGAVTLTRGSGGWELTSGGRTYPAAAERAEALAALLAALTRGTLVSGDAAHAAGLGLAQDAARLLVLHRGSGRADIGLFVGARAPSGEEDYMRVRGESAAWLVRGNLSVILSQDRAYWCDLSLFPAEVRGDEVVRISVSGRLAPEAGASSVDGGYVLRRTAAGQDGHWDFEGDGRAVDQTAANAMAEAVARLEADDFREAKGAVSRAGPAALGVEVTTREGKSFALHAGAAGGKVIVSTNWSPWTYEVNPVLFRRAIASLTELLARS